MKIKIPATLTRAANRAWLTTKKHSPELLLVGGIVAGGNGRRALDFSH